MQQANWNRCPVPYLAILDVRKGKPWQNWKICDRLPYIEGDELLNGSEKRYRGIEVRRPCLTPALAYANLSNNRYYLCPKHAQGNEIVADGKPIMGNVILRAYLHFGVHPFEL